ncbi:helix-turn-helix transcriptional regulator, partial [Sinomonas humi]
MPLQEVADAVGVNRVVMASIEEEVFVPSPDAAKRIAALFGQPVESIFAGDQVVTPAPLADPYWIPEEIFGYIESDLPEAIGRVVMLSALVEARIGQLLGSLTSRPFEKISGRDATANSKDCRAVLAAYDGSAMEDRFR